jgi:hypothetical protein
VDIVTSELTDDKFKEADWVSNKKEREYIVRLPASYKFASEDIEIVNLDYLVAAGDPLAVQHFSHDDMRADYEMNGYSITAKFQWNSSGTGGQVRFDANKDNKRIYSEGRATAKKSLGFDPMPTEDNLKDIKNFKFKYNKDSYRSNWQDL